MSQSGSVTSYSAFRDVNPTGSRFRTVWVTSSEIGDLGVKGEDLLTRTPSWTEAPAGSPEGKPSRTVEHQSKVSRDVDPTK